MTDLDKKRVDAIIRFALKEDIWTGDLTSRAVLEEGLAADGVVISRDSGIVCGISIMERVFAAVDAALRFRSQVKEGDVVEPGQEIAFVEGPARSIMAGERVALNFLSIMSGVSTSTRRMADEADKYGVKIYDTRKTIPLHRYLQKYAVTVGGGHNHRKGLWDMVLIKDNHIRAFGQQLKTRDTEKIIKGVLERAHSSVQKNIKIEIEVETLRECEYALDERPDVIMLDNMDPDTIKKAVSLRKEKGLEKDVLYEVSGGIDLSNLKDYASTGIDIISSGSITGVVKPLDFSLEIIVR
ncbi:MAG: carboxylating nicotinate-nucleotide diphosphorylase [Candidatus Omnitrophica bacterium]|nr:carboxylating nicotinate-nucleotide diphosphorylase [Candidatus Omnitrophota bacterium]